MIRKKMVMIGASGVGKTSLVSRSVFGIFSPNYRKTVGVCIDKKVIEVDGQTATLMLWDLQGEDEHSKIRTSYVTGSSGFFLVADGTRSQTLDVAVRLRDEVLELVPDIPFVLLVNKSDLRLAWQVSTERLETLRATGWDVVETSAKDGQGVEDAFDRLGRRMLQQR